MVSENMNPALMPDKRVAVGAGQAPRFRLEIRVGNTQFPADALGWPHAEPSGDIVGIQSPIVLSFDVEEHHCIEAAAKLWLDPALKSDDDARLETSTRLLLDQLTEHRIKASFFCRWGDREVTPRP
jgi:hypothetical protein